MSNTTNLSELEALAHEYAASSGYFQRVVVGTAISHPKLDEFISAYSKGWLSVEGQFARVLARVLQAM